MVETETDKGEGRSWTLIPLVGWISRRKGRAKVVLCRTGERDLKRVKLTCVLYDMQTSTSELERTQCGRWKKIVSGDSAVVHVTFRLQVWERLCHMFDGVDFLMAYRKC